MTREERRARGLCSGCDKPATEGRMCSAHAKRNRERTQALRLKRRAEGKCVCCNRKARGKPYYSVYCTMHGLERQLYISSYLRIRTEERRAAGLCVRCAVPCKGELCPKHAALVAEKHRKAYADKVSKGTCVRSGCWAKASSGYRHCSQHLGARRRAA